MIKNEGEAAEILSAERRRLRLAAISRDDSTEKILKNDRVCGRHFVSRKSAKPWDSFNEEWVPSLHLGHDKSKKSEKNQNEATERAPRIGDRRKREKQKIEEYSVNEKIRRLADDGEPVRHTFQQLGSQ